MVVVLGVIGIAFLLHEGPAAHVLQAPRWVASLNEADGLTGKGERNADANEHVSAQAAACNYSDCKAALG